MNIRSIAVPALALALIAVPALALAQQRPGLVSAGDYVAGTLGEAFQPARAAAQPGSVYRVGKWPTYTADLAPGKGRDTVVGNCSMCHSVTYITMQPPLPAAAWKAEVHKIIAAMGAPIQPATADEIVSYLQQHYTPQTRQP